MTSQLTGLDEREKKEKKDLQQQAQIEGVCIVDEGLLALLSAWKLKSNMGSNFSHTVVLSPPWLLRGPLPFGLYPHAPSLFCTAIAITFLLCLVPAR